MLCKSCNIEVAKTFVYAISQNICPACGKDIMDQENFKSYGVLKIVLEEINIADVDKVMCAILAKFNISLKGETITASISNIVETKTIDELDSNIKTTPKLDSNEVKRNKDILQKMRDEVLQEALQDKYGDEVSFTVDEEMNMHELINKEVREEKRNKIINGTGGTFRWSE